MNVTVDSGCATMVSVQWKLRGQPVCCQVQQSLPKVSAGKSFVTSARLPPTSSATFASYSSMPQVYFSTLTRDAEAAVARLTACLVKIKAWLKVSRLRLNPTKTHVMWLGSQQLAKVNVLEVPVALTRINVSKTARVLGVVIDSQLSLSAQVSVVCRSGYY